MQSGEDSTRNLRSRVLVRERLNLGSRRTATLDPRDGICVHVTTEVPDLRQTMSGQNRGRQTGQQTPLTPNLGSTPTTTRVQSNVREQGQTTTQAITSTHQETIDVLEVPNPMELEVISKLQNDF